MAERWHSCLEESTAVVALVQTNGRCLGEEFIKALPRERQAKFHRYFEYLRDGKQIKSPENMKHLRTEEGVEVHELKVHADGGYRLYLIPEDGRWLVTHGVRKVKDNRVMAEVSKALRLFAEWKEAEEN